jgi:hypothetical protein
MRASRANVAALQVTAITPGTLLAAAQDSWHWARPSQLQGHCRSSL